MARLERIQVPGRGAPIIAGLDHGMAVLRIEDLRALVHAACQLEVDREWDQVLGAVLAGEADRAVSG